LDVVIALLRELGSANDAEDHGHSEEAERIRANAVAAIRELLDTHPVICEVVPDLRAQLDDGSLFDFGWAGQMDRAQAHLDAG
jgi:hypothetical protein